MMLFPFFFVFVPQWQVHPAIVGMPIGEWLVKL
jgi:hypothetical protein